MEAQTLRRSTDEGQSIVLREPTGREDTAKNLASLANRLGGTENEGSVGYELCDLACAIRREGTSTPLAWAGVPLLQVFDLDDLATLLHPDAEARPAGRGERILGWMEPIRNTLILLPVALTWLGISAAVSAYGRYLAAPARDAAIAAVTQPASFIALWQTGFGGELWDGFSLGSLAFTSFVLILLVFGLSIVAHWQPDRVQARDDEQVKVEQARAVERNRLRALLIRASVLLAHDRSYEERRGLSATVDEIKTERGILVEQMKQQRADLYGSISEVLIQIQEIGTKFETVGKGHVAAIKTHVEAIEKQVETLSGAASEFKQLLVEHTKFGKELKAGSGTMLKSAQKLDALFGRVETSVDHLGAEMDKVATTIPPLTTAAERAAAGAADIVKGQVAATTAVVDAVAAMRAHQEQLKLSIDRAAALANILAGVQSGTVDAIRDHAEQLSQSAARLDGLLIPFVAQGTALASALDSSTAAANNATQRSETLATRLETMADGQGDVQREVQQLAASVGALTVRLRGAEQEMSAARTAILALSGLLPAERQHLADSLQLAVTQARDALTTQADALRLQTERAGQLAAQLASIHGGAGQAVRDHAREFSAGAERLEALIMALNSRFESLESALATAGSGEQRTQQALNDLRIAVERLQQAHSQSIDGLRVLTTRFADGSDGVRVQVGELVGAVQANTGAITSSVDGLAAIISTVSNGTAGGPTVPTTE